MIYPWWIHLRKSLSVQEKDVRYVIINASLSKKDVLYVTINACLSKQDVRNVIINACLSKKRCTLHHYKRLSVNKVNNKITELRAILQRESQNS